MSRGTISLPPHLSTTADDVHHIYGCIITCLILIINYLYNIYYIILNVCFFFNICFIAVRRADHDDNNNLLVTIIILL